jgi:hypothetical protein
MTRMLRIGHTIPIFLTKKNIEQLNSIKQTTKKTYNKYNGQEIERMRANGDTTTLATYDKQMRGKWTLVKDPIPYSVYGRARKQVRARDPNNNNNNEDNDDDNDDNEQGESATAPRMIYKGCKYNKYTQQNHTNIFILNEVTTISTVYNIVDIKGAEHIVNAYVNQLMAMKMNFNPIPQCAVILSECLDQIKAAGIGITWTGGLMPGVKVDADGCPIETIFQTKECVNFAVNGHLRGLPDMDSPDELKKQDYEASKAFYSRCFYAIAKTFVCQKTLGQNHHINYQDYKESKTEFATKIALSIVCGTLNIGMPPIANNPFFDVDAIRARPINFWYKDAEVAFHVGTQTGNEMISHWDKVIRLKYCRSFRFTMGVLSHCVTARPATQDGEPARPCTCFIVKDGVPMGSHLINIIPREIINLLEIYSWRPLALHSPGYYLDKVSPTQQQLAKRSKGDNSTKKPCATKKTKRN